MDVDRVNHGVARVMTLECQVKISAGENNGLGPYRHHAPAGIEEELSLLRRTSTCYRDLLIGLA